MPEMTYSTLLSIAPLRKEASDRSEMTSQILYGEHLEILDTQEKWLMVRSLEDNYEGWIDRKQVIEIPSGPRIMITRPFSLLNSHDGNRTILPACSFISEENEVVMIDTNAFEKPDQYDTSTPDDLAQYARNFLGTPYLWGGRTFAGIDCSGFSQTVLKVFGKKIPRDAYQQAELGETVSFLEESDSGDLAFFDNAEGRIVHVGIVIREKDKTSIVHASGCVREDLLDHNGIYNADIGAYTHQLRIIKRI
jgi:hypothetical protein